MRLDLAEHLSSVPRRLRMRHGPSVRVLEELVGDGERVRAVITGLLSGAGPVVLVATNRRVIGAGRYGWSISVLYSQISSVASGGWFGLNSTLTIHTAGTVLSLRAARASAHAFAAAVQAGVPGSSPAFAPTVSFAPSV